jgi:serine/threonine protein kinase/WD40 repeat protein
MKWPDEQQWQRVETLAEELKLLRPEEMASRLSHLATEGESRTVLTLLNKWLALPPPALPFKAGHVIGGRYTLKEKIGEGGMGSVWRAQQTMIGRDVALKMIHTTLATPSLKSQFVSEIEALGRLNHPGIVRIFDAGIHEHKEQSSIPFFTMELVDGVPLDRWATAPGVSHRSVLRVMMEVCEAVQSAHERRVVHRDLKPSNILVRPDGRPVVLDFGIARLAGTVSGEEAGDFSGTPLYAAPEQHLGHDTDFRSGESVDVYSTGVILFQILSGRKLFVFPTGASLTEIRKIVVEAPAPRLSSVLAECPPLLDELVARALRKDPADRFYSMAALGRAIGRAALHYGEPTPPLWVPSPGAIVPGTGWKLIQKIGQGGTGEIWLGAHEQLRERRVFKFCDTEEKARTLKRELTLFRLLKGRVGQNPHFVQLHEVSLDEPPWYLMMDYTEAKDLQAWAAEQPGGLAGVSIEVRIEIIVQVAEALQAAHEAGILHRDIKPTNLLVRGSAGQGALHVMIADFGIGQIVADELLREGTRLGFTRTVADLQRSHISGTLMYMAPEVFERNAATARSDIYSLGVVLWQLLIANLNTALDAADWSARISDPLLRADLARCLAGSPEKRWASAGELAASLRALPARRDADARHAAEIAHRERQAYRRGVARTALIASGIICLVVGLAWLALKQRTKARLAQGQIALEQAASLPRADSSAGRTARGLQLLEAATVTRDRAALRSAAAAVLGMSDLVRTASHSPPKPPPNTQIPARPGETCRAASHDGKRLTIALDLDGLNGAVELLNAKSGELLCRVERNQFPWVPVAERGLLSFSPDDSTVAIGGAATSRHVLLCNASNGAVHSYLYHGSDPLCCGWHSKGRLLAVGCADGTIRLWDKLAAVSPNKNLVLSNQFDLPPTLDVPAQDKPLHTLHGHRGAVRHIAFASGGDWLASLDSEGYLRIHHGFRGMSLPEPASTSSGIDIMPELSAPAPVFAVEVRLEDVNQVTALDAEQDTLVIRRGAQPPEEYQFVPSELPAELHFTPVPGGIALNAQGTELCAITPTDIHWLSASPLEVLQTKTGENPLGACSQLEEACWLITKDRQITEWRPTGNGPWPKKQSSSTGLIEAQAGQGTRTAATTDGQYRVAAYCGRRIQFFADLRSGGSGGSIAANGGGGIFREIFWDWSGRLLGVVFELPDGLRLESWETTTNFPPACRALPPAILKCERIVPANDGRHCIARGGTRGLFRFDPANDKETPIDTSSTARRNAPLACTPDGSFLAIVADRNTVRLLALPGGTLFADLSVPERADLTLLTWDGSNRHLAATSSDGYIEVWNLGPWKDWLERHGLQK